MAVLNRRRVLIGGAAGAGLLVAWGLWPRSYQTAPGWNGDRDAAGSNAAFNAYLQIAQNGSVIIAVPQCEMGQGVTTVLAQIIAEELGADWRSIAIEPAPPAPVFANRVLMSRWADMIIPAGVDLAPSPDDLLIDRLATRSSFCVTADDTEIANYELPCREAAATARIMLCQAAAARWDVDWRETTAADGFVAFGNERFRFADLLDEALEFDPPDPPELRETLPGNVTSPPIGDAPPFSRLDLPAKVDGSANFAGDIRLPDMVYAAIRQGPVGDSKLKSVNSAPARKVTGLIDVIKHDRWVACIASNWWAANTALSKLRPVFETRGALAESETIDDALNSAFRSKGGRMFKRGDVDAAFASGKSYVQRFDIAAAPHATIETSTATARYTDGVLELWIASQAPGDARDLVAKAMGLAKKSVVIYPMMAGGSFDRRLDNEVAVQVALLAKTMRRPVQLIWSRGEEMIQDPVRTPAIVRMAASTDTNGRIIALSSKTACPATAREFGKRLFSGDARHEAMHNARGALDGLAVAGAVPPYGIANWAVDHYPANIGIATGRWRGNAASYGVFANECFVDELAALHQKEPLSYRMQMLGENVRLARCLTRVAALAEWDGGLDNSGQGVACCQWQDGYIAVVASVRRDGDVGGSGLRVEKLSAVVDAGRVINHDIALQQIEGGMIFGLAMAMGCATGYSGGLTDARRLRDLALPQMGDTPEIEVEFIDSEEAPAGLGELGVPAVAPAIANALHSATGLRFRQLPLLSGGL